MLTIPEIRLALADEMPEDNYLLDAVEFQDYQIMAAIRRPIELWNSLPPLDQRYGFNIQNFPYRYYWMQMTISCLLEMAAHNKLRNDIPLSGGGIDTRDAWQHKEYHAKAQEMKSEFKDWAQSVKASLSVMDAWGTVHSDYYRPTRGGI